jgi:ATP-binding cassette subfamily B protein
VNNVKAGMMEIVPKLVSMAVGFFGAAAILISMDFRFAFVLVAGGVLGAWLVEVLRSPMKRRQRSVRRMEGKLQSSLQETLQNLRLVKASGSERRMTDQLSRYQEQYYSVVMEQSLFTAKVNASLGLVFQFSWLFCMLWGGWSIYQGVLTYGSLAAIIRLVGEIQSPISEAADVAGRALVTVTSAERLKELLDLPDEEALTGAGGGEMYAGLEEIRLDNVTFSYGRESGNVLEQASAVIRPGDFAALTGISGGGKSTLFQLLLGIYRPEEGRVLFRFRGQEETASRRTRPLFAYVPQGNTLFSGTLRENFAMFTDNASDEEIMQAAETACVDRLVLELDEGLDTVIGERGVGLSEGQAQRVAVARALLSRAPILLLDESTSALDEETEARLLSNLSRLKQREGRGVTCLIVTHRRAALAICDYRLHVENAGIRRIDSSQEPAIAEQEEDGV